MPDTRLPKQLLYGQLHDSQRSVGRPKLRYKDKLKDNLKKCYIDVNTWEDLAKDRKFWRATCFAKLKNFEEKRVEHRDLLRQHLKQRHLNSRAGSSHVCHCGFAARSKAGLVHHIKRHLNPQPSPDASNPDVT